MWRKYYRLSKPGIVYGNVLTALAGYFLASAWHIRWSVLLGLAAGLSLVIAGACSWNNYLDRGLDKAMKRTAKRPSVTGSVKPLAIISYATAVFAIGLLLLILTQNSLTVVLALVAFADYVALYDWSKRKTVHGTLIGTISGSIPLVMGYTAVTDKLDVTAGLLFLLMAAWQMAHFYGIALYRLKDYTAAHVAVLPAVRGVRETISQTCCYMALFLACSFALLAHQSLTPAAAIVLLAAGLWWLWRAWQKRSEKSEAWGKSVFLDSLLVMCVMCGCLALGGL